MSRWSALLFALVVLVGEARGAGQASGAAAPSRVAPAAPQVGLRLVTEEEEVDLGKAFPLSVVRTWTPDLVPEDWDDAALAPLVVRLLESTRRVSDEGVEEIRRYRAYAFLPDAVTVPEVSFVARPRGGGEACVARAGPIALRVRSALESATPGAAELPGDLLPAPRRWPMAVIVVVLAASVVLLGGLGWWLQRSRAAAVGTALAPDAVALRRLRMLRDRGPRTPEELEADCGEVAALLRDYLAGRFAVNAGEMTSSELTAALRARDLVPGSGCDHLEEILVACDRGKFGRLLPTTTEMDSLLEPIRSFIEVTRSEVATVAGRDPEPPGGGDA